jgi:hypothetical protein
MNALIAHLHPRTERFTDEEFVEAALLTASPRVVAAVSMAYRISDYQRPSIEPVLAAAKWADAYPPSVAYWFGYSTEYPRRVYVDRAESYVDLLTPGARCWAPYNLDGLLGLAVFRTCNPGAPIRAMRID